MGLPLVAPMHLPRGGCHHLPPSCHLPAPQVDKMTNKQLYLLLRLWFLSSHMAVTCPLPPPAPPAFPLPPGLPLSPPATFLPTHPPFNRWTI